MISIDKLIPLDQIRPGRFQPRQDFDGLALHSLAESIRDQGLLNRIIVFLGEDGNYELLAGERRWRASCALAIAPHLEEDDGLVVAAGIVTADAWPQQVARGDWRHALANVTIPASDRPADISPQAQHAVAVVDNLQRQDLNPIEEAQALQNLKDDLGLSLRALAAKVGKSKSYVEDRLRLRDLSDEVAGMVVAEDSPLDLSLARELARKIPAPLQKPLAERLQKLAGQIEAAKLLKVVGDIARFIDLNRWSLSHDTDIPHAPAYANRARLMRTLLETGPPDKLAGALVYLSGLPQGAYTNYLSKKVDALLGATWEFERAAAVLCFGEKEKDGDAWEHVAAREGWACDTCALKMLHGAIETPVDSFGWRSPCRKLDRHADPDKITTCPGYIGPDDPPVIVVQSGILDYLGDPPDDAGLLRHPLQGADSVHYVESWTDYHHLYIAAAQARERAQGERAAADQVAHLAPMREYWEAQNAALYGEEEIFDLSIFQAHACRRCVNFLPDTDRDQSGAPGYPPCALAYSPLTTGGQTRPPDYGVWVSKAGQAVPRCERFQVREFPAVQRAIGDSFTIGDRELILGWYKQLTGQISDHQARGLKIYSPLRWLTGPRPNLARLWAEIGDDDIMMALLNIGVTETSGGDHHYSINVETLDPDGGRMAWKVMDWREFTQRRKPYNWDDWPLPWKGKN